MKPKLLIAGGGYADIPLIESGRSLGFHVITSGNRPNDLGHHFSDEVRFADFSDPEAMLTLAKDLSIDAICSACNDFSALSAAYVAEQLGLPGHDSLEVAEVIHHKDRYREFAQRNQIATPLACGFDSLIKALAGLEAFTYPVIIKPVDLTGGKGVSKAINYHEAREAIKHAFDISRAKRIVIEEFIEGSRHGISTFLRDGKVVFFFHDDEYYYKNPYLVSAASTPGSISESVVKCLIATIERVAKLLNLVTGIVHVQFIVDKSGNPIIIEICRRSPGDLYVNLVKYATGVDYPSYIVKAACGIDCSDLKQPDHQKYITRHCIMSSAPGSVKDVIFDDGIKNQLVDEFTWWKPGDAIEDHLTQKLGIVFVCFDSLEVMREKTTQMQELIEVKI